MDSRSVGSQAGGPSPSPGGGCNTEILKILMGRNPVNANPFLDKKVVSTLMKFLSFKDLKKTRLVCHLWDTESKNQLLENHCIRLNCKDAKEAALVFADLITPGAPMSEFTGLNICICNRAGKNFGALIQRIFPVHGHRLKHLTLEMKQNTRSDLTCVQINNLFVQAGNVKSLMLIMTPNFLCANFDAAPDQLCQSLTKLHLRFLTGSNGEMGFNMYLLENSVNLKTLILEPDPLHPKSLAASKAIKAILEKLCEIHPPNLRNLQVRADVNFSRILELCKSNLILDTLYIGSYKYFELDFSLYGQSHVYSIRGKYRATSGNLPTNYHVEASNLEKLVSYKKFCFHKFGIGTGANRKKSCISFLCAVKSVLTGHKNRGLLSLAEEFLVSVPKPRARRVVKAKVVPVNGNSDATTNPTNPFLIKTVVENLVKWLELIELKQCRSVCKLWNRQAKSQILSNHCVRISTTDTIERLRELESMMKDGGSLAGMTGLRFAYFGETNQPTEVVQWRQGFYQRLCSQVKHLTLTANPNNFDPTALKKILTDAKYIRSLKLEIPSMTYYNNSVRPLSLLIWPYLTKLELKLIKRCNYWHPSIKSFVKYVLEMSPYLESLILASDSIDAKNFGIKTALGDSLAAVCEVQPARLKSLRISCRLRSRFVKLLRNNNLIKLDSLYIEDYKNFELDFSTNPNTPNKVWSRFPKHNGSSTTYGFASLHDLAAHLENVVMNKTQCLQKYGSPPCKQMNCLDFLRAVASKLSELKAQN